MKSNNKLDANLITPLCEWYQKNKRSLPWRNDRDPYRIWISEVMLQQTVSSFVEKYFQKFLSQFPTVQSLADASIESVYEYWTGLGYYSRARNLHKSAKLFAERGFPKSFEELIEFPGFGPYTSRAVASLAFDQKVGVLDGNVIRILCRVYNLSINWWESQHKADLQKLTDRWALQSDPYILNQAMMELGATVCTPANPNCFACPWVKDCKSYKHNTQGTLPLKKPRRRTQVLIWQPQIIFKTNKVALIPNSYAPFLKNMLIFPGEIILQKAKPKSFDIKHRITHHEIYIQIRKQVNWNKKNRSKKIKWINLDQIPTINPSSLMQKILQRQLKSEKGNPAL